MINSHKLNHYDNFLKKMYFFCCFQIDNKNGKCLMYYQTEILRPNFTHFLSIEQKRFFAQKLHPFVKQNSLYCTKYV